MRMKTYFMSWESDNKRGHAIWDFAPTIHGVGVSPRQALATMLDSVTDEFSKAEIPIVGAVTATQFNLVT
jgi:hypothetical protein